MSSGPVALWQMIANDLAAKIASGELAPGVRLPTENALAKHYAVNRHTVRRSIQRLVMEDLVQVTQGRGSFVRRPLINIDYSSDIYAPSDVNIELAKRGHGHENPVRIEPATAQMAKALQIKISDPMAVIDFVVRSADEEVLALISRTMPLKRMPGILDAFRETQNLPKALERMNIRQIKRKWVRMRARAATADERAALAISAHTPLLIVGCLFVSVHGDPVFHDCSLFASDKVEVYSHAQLG